VAVVATLSKGYDLDCIWRQVDQGPVKDAADYYIQATSLAANRQTGGGLGPKALGFEPGQMVERSIWAGRRAAAGKPLTCTPGYWPPSRTPPLDANWRRGARFLLPEIDKAVAEMFSASKGMYGSPRTTVSSRLFLSGVD
jgi:hypothetical protein